jgi:hypothetical protein
VTLRRPGTTAMIVAAVLALGLAMPASAFEVIQTTGSTGDYGWLPADDPSSPAARCGYSEMLSDGYVHLRWIKVRAPRIIARDVTGSRDQQQAGWKVIVQREVGAGSWTKVASSGFQMKTTYDDASAAFMAIKVNVSGQYGQHFRAVAVLRWVRNGSVEGSVKARMEYYGPKWSLGPITDTSTDYCLGAAK